MIIQENNHFNSNLMEKQRLNVRQISIRARSKKEMYRLLQLEADVYLPPIQQTNRRFIADIVSEKKKVIHVVVIIISALEK